MPDEERTDQVAKRPEERPSLTDDEIYRLRDALRMVPDAIGGPTNPSYEGLSPHAHPALYPIAEIGQLVDALGSLMRCGHGITRSERRAPAFPSILRCALLEIQKRTAKALTELDKLETTLTGV